MPVVEMDVENAAETIRRAGEVWNHKGHLFNVETLDIYVNRVQQDARFSLDPKRQPHWIDWRATIRGKEQTVLGLYELRLEHVDEKGIFVRKAEFPSTINQKHWPTMHVPGTPTETGTF